MFRPPKELNRLLLSSPVHFVGEFESSDYLLTHAWRDEGAVSNPESDYHRSFFSFSFQWKDQSAPSNFKPLPDLRWVGEQIATFMSVFYGKRIDFEGLLESNGLFRIPTVNFNSKTKRTWPVHGNAPRKDIPIPLNLGQFHLLLPLVEGFGDGSKLEALYTASKFYRMGVQMMESNPDISFTNFVTAGEVLSNMHTFSDEELFDDGTLRIIGEMERLLGKSDASAMKRRLLQVKRRFVKTLSMLSNDALFAITEANEPWAGLQKAVFDQTLKHAYDLRSGFLHGGLRLDIWALPALEFVNEELNVRDSSPTDKRLRKMVEHAPTVIGLERILRFCILRYAHLHLTPIHSVLV